MDDKGHTKPAEWSDEYYKTLIERLHKILSLYTEHMGCTDQQARSCRDCQYRFPVPDPVGILVLVVNTGSLYPTLWGFRYWLSVQVPCTRPCGDSSTGCQYRFPVPDPVGIPVLVVNTDSLYPTLWGFRY